MSKQTNNDELNLRAKLLKRQHRTKRRAEINRRRVENGRAPSMIVTLRTINQYKKLVCYTESKENMEVLLRMDEKHYVDSGRSPIWVDPDKDGIFFKVSVPKFMSRKLFEWDTWCGEAVEVTLSPKTYESEQYGNGWYLALNGDLRRYIDG